MARGKRKKKRPGFGMPVGIVLLRTPEGWRHQVSTVDREMHCGRVAGVSADADPAEARDAAAAMAVRLAHDFHGVDVDVTWRLPQERGSWTAEVTVAAKAAT